METKVYRWHISLDLNVSAQSCWDNNSLEDGSIPHVS